MKPKDPEQERGERIIRQMRRLQRERRPVPHRFGPVLLALILIAVIIAVVMLNRERFGFIWNHLVKPDSVPGIGP